MSYFEFRKYRYCRRQGKFCFETQLTWGYYSWIFTKGDGFDLGTIEDKSTRAQFDVQRVDRAIQLTEHWEDEEH